jgi:prolyl-tRNA editing enzyme YbaK/EbsC (Cys-tRNA(Pro) deacylase)
MVMLARVVEYLRSNDVPFRLESYPSPELEPHVAHAVRPRTALSVDARIVLIDGRPAIGCVPTGEELNTAGLRNNLGAEIVEEGTIDDLPWFLDQVSTPMPPLGRLFGVPLFVDERVAAAQMVCFAAFAPNDFIEMAYDDLARIEQPRIAPVGVAGELPPAELH